MLKVFTVDLYNKGLIYRGMRMVNWDPGPHRPQRRGGYLQGKTASKLYYLKYYAADDDMSGETGPKRVFIVTLPASVMP